MQNFQGYGPAVKAEEEVERVQVSADLNVDRHMNVNVTSSGQGTKTVILQIPKVCYSATFISTWSDSQPSYFQDIK